MRRLMRHFWLSSLCLFVFLCGVAFGAEPSGVRTWTASSGKSIEARLAGFDGGNVVLVTGEGKRFSIDPGSLSEADREYIDAHISPLDGLAGVWTGSHCHKIALRNQILTVKKLGGVITAEGYVYTRLPRGELDRIIQKRIHSSDQYPESYIVRQSYAVSVDGQTVTFRTRGGEYVFNGDDPYPTQTFTGRFKSPGILAGEWTNTSGGHGYFTWAKDGALARRPPLNIEKGVTHSMECLDGGPYHYTLYVPKNYDPAKPAPVLINDDPCGNAPPFLPRMAEELGWVMAGLTESKNGSDTGQDNGENCMTTLFDLQRRLNVDMRRIYFSGLSGGSRRSSLRAIMYPDECAGIFCIGAGFSFGEDKKYRYPPPGTPIFFITGEKDTVTEDEVQRVAAGEEKKGRVTKLIVHPGGHDWGPESAREEALRWMDSQWKPPSAGKKTASAPTAHR